MPDQDEIKARKAASAAGAADNSGVGVNGDDPSAADTATEHANSDDSSASPDEGN